MACEIHLLFLRHAEFGALFREKNGLQAVRSRSKIEDELPGAFRRLNKVDSGKGRYRTRSDKG
jgi:hypothetical protein